MKQSRFLVCERGNVSLFVSVLSFSETVNQFSRNKVRTNPFISQFGVRFY